MRGIRSPVRFDSDTFRSIGTSANQKGGEKTKTGRRLIMAGIYDVFDLETPALPQAVAFLETLEKNADCFRQLMLKYGEANDASIISALSFWLLQAGDAQVLSCRAQSSFFSEQTTSAIPTPGHQGEPHTTSEIKQEFHD